VLYARLSVHSSIWELTRETKLSQSASEQSSPGYLIKNELPHLHLHHLLTFQNPFQLIIALHWAYAGGCAGEDHVTDVEGEEAGDVGYDVVYGEDHIAGMAVLHGIAVLQ